MGVDMRHKFSYKFPSGQYYNHVVYESNALQIATVDQNGIIQARKQGKAQIKVTAGKVSEILEVEVRPARNAYTLRRRIW